jgi:outer membrane protein insertion porin family
VIRLVEAVLVVTALSASALTAQDRPADLIAGSVTFKGNRALDDVTLAASISTSQSSWFYRFTHKIGDRQPWDETEFRRDVVRLQLLYRQHGFYEARIDTSVDRRDRLVDPTFRIQEGPPVVVDTVVVTGVDSVRGGSSLVNGLLLQQNARFDRFLFEASGDSIAFAVRDRGYPFAIVFRNFTVNRLTRHATVQFDVLPGPHAAIGAIAVAGNDKISERTVRRTLTVREGDEFRRMALLRSQRSLYESELFRYASVGVATPDSIVGGQDSLVRVRIQVAEATPTRMRVGLGYGTIDCLRASGTLTALNFVGEARRLDVVSRVSKIGVGAPLDFGLRRSLCRELDKDVYSDSVNYLGSVTLSQPASIVRGAVVSVQGFAERRSEFGVYLITSIGGAISLKFGVGRNRGIPVSLTYRLSRDQTTADTLTYCVYFDQCDLNTISSFSAKRRQGALSLSVVNQHVDSPIEPTRGETYTLQLTTASPWLGSQVVFDRLVAEAVAYRPLPRRRVVSARLRGGIIREGLSRIGGIELRYVPPAERFYAGGPNSVRGYGRNEMGPLVYVFDSVDTSKRPGADTLAGLRSSPLGSSAMILANIELRTPTPLLGGRVGMSVFVDGAELWNYNGSTYVPGGFRLTPGIGFQVATPLGPMRLTSAYNGYRTQKGPLYRLNVNGGSLTLLPDEYGGNPRSGSFLGRLQWHFSVGLAF